MYANKRAMKALIGVSHQIVGKCSVLFIKNVPPGSYKVVAWHEMDAKYEGFREIKEVQITDENTKLSFKMKKGPKHKK